MTRNAYSKLLADIKKNGIQDRVVKVTKINDEYYVLLGNNRVMAARQLGKTDELIFEEVKLPFSPSFRTERDVINAFANLGGR